MKAPTRTSARRKQHRRTGLAAPLCNPVGKAVAMHALRGDILNMGIKCLAVEHGSAQRELLGQLAFMIGMGAEVAAKVQVLGENRRGLHQSLAQVLRMALDGCAWDASWAAQLQLALEVSAELMVDNHRLAMAVLPGAMALGEDVRVGRVRADAIVPFAEGVPQ